MRNTFEFNSLSIGITALSVIFLTWFASGCQSSTSITSISQSANSISNSSTSASKILGSVSKSLGSISSSIKSVSGSLSESSSKEEEDEKEESYRSDVKNFTSMFMGSSGSEIDFQRDISRIARNNGITYWEREPSTYLGIGAGLKKAGLSESDVGQFIRSFAETNRNAARMIRKGYETI